MPSIPITSLRAGIIGSGFIGPVHIEALRRIGVQVTGICGSASAQTIADKWAIPHVFPNYDHRSLIHHPEVDVVHITSPNRWHFEQAAMTLTAGKHVVCEKPLAMTAAETEQLVKLAAQHERQIFAVNYNVRFYPAVLQLRADIAAGRLGKLIHVNGSYMQDWLLKPTDYNWRLLAKDGGELRAVGDIGTHWMDTVSFILGSEIEAVMAQLSTFHTTRQRPLGEMKTFSSDISAELQDYKVDTEDFANILLRFAGGTLGNVAVSQVAAGRKNCIRIELYGTKGSAWWNSEEPNTIHYGSRDGSNREAQRSCPDFTETSGFTDYPPGHAEGFPDTFKMLYRAVYNDISKGRLAQPLYATAMDGHHEVKLCEAILASHRSQQWHPL